MTVKIWLNNSAVENQLLNGQGIENIERGIMEQTLREIQGQFVIDFGTEGAFKIEGRTTAPSRFGTHRTAFKISAADAKTAAILHRNPGWLGKFSQ